MYIFLLLAMLQGPSAGRVSLRAGCLADDEQIASTGPSDRIRVLSALAGEGQTCYKVALERSGADLTGYVLGDSLPAVRAFVHGRELASEAASEAEARFALEQAAKPEKGNDSANPRDSTTPADPLISTEFADFSARDIAGKPFRLSGLNGQATVVAFWSPASRSTIAELEQIRPLYNGLHAKGLAAVGISTDPRAGRMWDALDDVTLPFAQVPDTRGLAAQYNVDPKAGKVLVLDANHRIIAAGPMGPEIVKAVQQAMNVSAGQ